MSNIQPFFKEVFNIPESSCKDIENQLENTSFNGICILGNSSTEVWSAEMKDTLEKIIALTGQDYGNCLHLGSKAGEGVLAALGVDAVSHLLIFDNSINQQGLAFHLPKEQWLTLNGKKVFSTIDLSAFVADKRAKGALWKALQEEFEAARNFKK